MTRDPEVRRPATGSVIDLAGRRTLHLVVIVAAAAAVTGGLLADPIGHAATISYLRFAAAILVAAVAQVARIPLRVSESYVSLGWGEGALIV